MFLSGSVLTVLVTDICLVLGRQQKPKSELFAADGRIIVKVKPGILECQTVRRCNVENKMFLIFWVAGTRASRRNVGNASAGF